MKELKEILEILLKYSSNNLVYAEHDIIYFSASDPSVMKKEDVESLNNLGCHYDANLPSWYINC